jgi:uncharacterized protein DUF1501
MCPSVAYHLNNMRFWVAWILLVLPALTTPRSRQPGPPDNPVEVPDLVATLYHKLGVDYTKKYVSTIGRPIKLAGDGKPLAFL